MSGFGNFLKAGANSLIGGTITALGSIGAGKRQEARQKRLMDYEDQIADENYSKQLSDQRQLIDEERAYNDFGSVMSRAAAAGLNPLYAVGAPSTGGNISTSTPSQGDPSIPAASQDPQQVAFGAIGSAVTESLDAAIKSEQLEQMKLQTAYDEQTLDYRVALSKAVTEGQEATNALSAAMTDKTEKESLYIEMSTSYTEALKNRTERLTSAELNKLQAEYDKLMSEATNLDIRNAQQRDLLDAQIRSINAATWAALQQGSVFREQGKYVGYDAYTRRMDAESRQKANDLQSEYQKNLKDYNDALIAYNNDKLSVEKRNAWINAGTKLLSTMISTGGTVFALSSGAGAAKIGAASMSSNPFDDFDGMYMAPGL